MMLRGSYLLILWASLVYGLHLLACAVRRFALRIRWRNGAGIARLRVNRCYAPGTCCTAAAFCVYIVAAGGLASAFGDNVNAQNNRSVSPRAQPCRHCNYGQCYAILQATPDAGRITAGVWLFLLPLGVPRHRADATTHLFACSPGHSASAGAAP